MAEQHIPVFSTQLPNHWRLLEEMAGGRRAPVFACRVRPSLRLALTPAILYWGIFTLKAQSEKANLFCHVWQMIRLLSHLEGLYF